MIKAEAEWTQRMRPCLQKHLPDINLEMLRRGATQLTHVTSSPVLSTRTETAVLPNPSAPAPVVDHLRRVACKLAARQPVTVLAVGGSNTDGRYHPYYTTVLENLLNEVFPIDANASRQTHAVIALGRGGWGSSGWTTRGGMDGIRTSMRAGAGADLVLFETEPNDAPVFANTWGRRHLPPIWADDSVSMFGRNRTMPSARFRFGLDFWTLAQLEAMVHTVRLVVPDVSIALLGLNLAPLIGAHRRTRANDTVTPPPPKDSRPPRAQCRLVDGTSTEWPMLVGPDCNAELDGLPGPLHWCRTQRWSRPFEDCLGVPAVSLSDALWPEATTPALRAQLSPLGCKKRCMGPELPPKPRIFSFDSSGHVGAYGNKIVAVLVVGLLAQAVAALRGNANALVPWCAAHQAPPTLPAHYITATELARMQTAVTLPWTDVEVGDGWCLCTSVWPAVCTNGWGHAVQGRGAEWAIRCRREHPSVGPEKLSWTVTLAAHHPSARVSLQFIQSSFKPYGRFEVSVTAVGGGSTRQTVIVDGRAPEHTVSNRALIAHGLESPSMPGRQWRFTVTPLAQNSSIGANETQIILQLLSSVPDM